MMGWLQKHYTARGLLTVLRVWLGFAWLSEVIPKVGSPMWTASGMGKFLEYQVTTHGHPVITGGWTHFVTYSIQPWFASFLQKVVIPHAVVFSYLVVVGELLVGVALITGAFTGFAALMGLMMNAAYLLAGVVSQNPNMGASGFSVGRRGLTRPY